MKFLLEHAAGALFLDPGLGKTSIVLAALMMLKKMGVRTGRVLVVAPLRVCHEVWPREIEKWKDFASLRVVVLHGPKKNDLLDEDADIFVINPEGLEWLLGVTKTKTPSGKTRVAIDQRRWKKLGFDTLVVDELTKFKHTQTQRFKALKLVLGSFGRRWGLTGSPAANGLLDLFGQCYVIDQGRSLGPYITHYRMKYFTPSFDGFSWTLREGADKEIFERLRPLALRMSAEDYLEIPPVVENTITVELPKDSRRVYDAVERDLVASIEDGTIVAANAAAASTKCRQIANGGVYLEDVEGIVKPLKYIVGAEWARLHDEKTEAVADLVDELQGQPLLVAYDFAHDLERLRARLGEDTPYIGGGVSTKKTAEIIRRWNDGEIPVLLVHPQSVGHGLNLQGGGFHICFHSLTWNFELYDQLIRRLRRQGSKASRIVVHHVVARDTIDEVIVETLKSKDHNQRALFDALVKRARR